MPSLVVVVSEAAIVVVIEPAIESIECFDYDNDNDNDRLTVGLESPRSAFSYFVETGSSDIRSTMACPKPEQETSVTSSRSSFFMSRARS